jgi:hypothetical protein
MSYIFTKKQSGTTVLNQFITYQLPVFWDDEYQRLDYIQEEFNDPHQLMVWRGQGYANRFTGDMCDMRSPQPSWNMMFLDFFQKRGWQDIGTSYYRMKSGTVLPTHQDRYVRYIDLFALQGQEQNIRRAIVFLEDWKPGHYAEYNDQPLTQWKAGTVVEWQYDLPHMAANLGQLPRYTLQVTGHV